MADAAVIRRSSGCVDREDTSAERSGQREVFALAAVHGLLSRCGGRSSAANHGLGEAIHFFELGTELEEDEVDAGGFELGEALGDLFGSADEAGAQAAIRN